MLEAEQNRVGSVGDEGQHLAMFRGMPTYSSLHCKGDKTQLLKLRDLGLIQWGQHILVLFR